MTATTISVGCFGASHVEGWTYVDDKLQFSPFSTILEKDLGNGFIRTKNFGVSGATSSELLDMLQGMKEVILKWNFDFFVILCGSNDLGQSTNIGVCEVICDNIERMCGLVKGWTPKTVPILVTIPPLGLRHVQLCEKAVVWRQRVNDMIQNLARRNGFPCVPLHDAVSMEYAQFSTKRNESTGEIIPALFLKEKYDADGLHMTPEGYRCMAQMVYEVLMQQMEVTKRKEGEEEERGAH